MDRWLTGAELSGSVFVAAPVAVLAGLFSFFSPCVLPLLPGYLSYATGLSGADLAQRHVGGPPGTRHRLLAGSVLFVVGFSAVFVTLGVASGSLALWFGTNQRLFRVVLGCLSVLMGLAFMGLLPLFQRDLRVHRLPAVGLAAAPLLGVLFATGWTPCIGPTLGVILTVAATESPTRGGILLAFYSLGLGTPFIATALAGHRLLGASRWVRRHQPWVTRTGGLMLVAIGLLLLSGWWNEIVQWAQLNLATT